MPWTVRLRPPFPPPLPQAGRPATMPNGSGPGAPPSPCPSMLALDEVTSLGAESGAAEFVAGLMSAVGGLSVSAGLSAVFSAGLAGVVVFLTGVVDFLTAVDLAAGLGAGFAGGFTGTEIFSVWVASVLGFSSSWDFLAAPWVVPNHPARAQTSPTLNALLNGFVAKVDAAFIGGDSIIHVC